MTSRIPRGPLCPVDPNVQRPARGADPKVGEKRQVPDVRTLQDQEGWEAISEATGLTVQTLLETKMTGKSKHDLKGKLDQCMSYIKNLRACVRFLDTEALMLEADRDSLDTSIRELQEEHEKQMQLASEAASQLNKQLEDQVWSLEEQKGIVIVKEELIVELQDKLAGAANQLSKTELRAKSLEEDVRKLQPQLEEANKQLSNTQELYNKSQDYIANLQEYNAQKQRESIALNSDRANLQEENKTLSSELAKLTGSSTVLQAQLESCKTSLEEVEKAKAQAQEDCSRLRADLTNASGERDSLSAQLAAAQARLEEFEKMSGQAVTELKTTKEAKQQLEHKTAAQATTIQQLQEQLAGYQVSGVTAQSRITSLSQDNASLENRVVQLTNDLQVATSQIHGHEAHRRKLHNTILEIKGNIRVFCRVRPPAEDSAAESVKALLDEDSATGSGVELSLPGTDSQPGATHMFTFDRVFGAQSSQEDVFSEISQLVQSALDGNKVCIFAYGQTGSGKTHTMLGDTQHPGMIPRAMEQIFIASKQLEQQGWEFNLTASMMEIHNEEYKDLLGKGLQAGKTHKVVHDAAGNTTVSDLRVMDVSRPDSFEQLLTRAMASRSVGATALNERSSRSHCVFTLRIDAVCEATGEKARGVLNLIDLAGSERLSKSLAQGERLKETQAINKSLSALGDVISAIGSHAEHVPYRNSKLTWYLQPCLGGDAKTLMFVNVAPTAAAANETLCSLRFATKVNACEVGGLKRSRSGALRN